MWNWNWKEWLVAALIRALKTLAQTAVATITVGSAWEEVQWLHVASVSGVAFVLSMLTSLAGLPEVKANEEAEPPDLPEDF